MTAGTVIIAVFLIFDFLEEKQEFSVFLITLINISGKAAENGNDHHPVGNCGASQLENSAGE